MGGTSEGTRDDGEAGDEPPTGDDPPAPPSEAPPDGVPTEDGSDEAPDEPPSDPPPPPTPLWTRVKEVLSVWSNVLGVVIGLSAVASYVWVTVLQGEDPSRILEADVGVVVAEFSTASGEELSGVADLSATFSDELEAELVERAAQPAADGSSLSAEVLRSTDVDPLDPEPFATLAAGAEELASDHEADAVVTATVSEDRRTITPYLYLPPAAVPDALELAGLHPMGSPISSRAPVDRNMTARASVRSELTARVGAIAEVLIGLHRFGNGQYDDAEDRFESALDGLADQVHHGVVLLFLGNTALKDERLDDAERWYRDGLEVVGTDVSARLELGLAEVAFHRTKGACIADSDRRRALLDLRADYQEVVAAGDARAGQLFLDRASFGLARVEVCLATMGDVPWEDPSGIYARLARSYDDGGGDGVTQELASESLAGLGYIAPRGGVMWDRDLCADARSCYSRAADLALDPERRAVFSRRAAEAEGG